MAPAQAYVTSYAPRLRQYANSFITPVIQTQTLAPTARTTIMTMMISMTAKDQGAPRDCAHYAAKTWRRRREQRISWGRRFTTLSMYNPSTETG